MYFQNQGNKKAPQNYEALSLLKFYLHLLVKLITRSGNVNNLQHINIA